MAEEEQIVSWDEAITGSSFVKFQKDQNGEYSDKTIKIVNWSLVKCEKFGQKDVVEFRADVLEEDGGKVSEKMFTTASNRLKTKLKNILTDKDPATPVTITILPIGEEFARQYSVKEVK